MRARTRQPKTARAQASPRLSDEQRETLERGLRILARMIVRAHLRRQSAAPATIGTPQTHDSDNGATLLPHEGEKPVA